MSHWMEAEKAKNPPMVTVTQPGLWRVRDHYCTARRAVIGLGVTGMHEEANVFCPLCGTLATADFTKHRDAIRTWRETVARVVERHGCAPLVRDWLQASPKRQDNIGRRLFPALRHELRLLAERLAEELRARNGELLELADEALKLQFLRTDLEERQNDRDATEPTARQGFVYLIAGGDAVKIGYSEQHPNRSRLPELQIASWHELRLLGLIVGPIDKERELHKRFARLRIRGEWFQHAAEIVDYFRENGIPV